MTREYRSAAAFKEALEQRLRTASSSGVDFARRRQLVVFDRLLARVAFELGDAVTLKGGLAVELRIARARTTKDVDLQVTGRSDDILDRLHAAARRELGDFMVFTIRPDDRHPDIQNDGMKYNGVRLRAECNLAGKVYGRPFGVDVAFGGPILGEPELIVADDVLGFAELLTRVEFCVVEIPRFWTLSSRVPLTKRVPKRKYALARDFSSSRRAERRSVEGNRNRRVATATKPAS